VDLTVKNLVLSYETLANKALKLNKSYLDLLKLYEQLNLAYDLLVELEKTGKSPVKVVEAMQRDKQMLEDKFSNLAELIAKAKLDFTTEPEASELSAIAHDCQVMQNFINSLKLSDLKQMFARLINS
jgi:hypothetical protein